MARNPSHSRKAGTVRTAFTLIELLVVIAIIALLVSILMPSLQQARTLAGLAACKVNQRNMYTALVGYAQGHNGWLPWVGSSDNRGYGSSSEYVSRGRLFWGGLLLKERWMDMPKAFLCPGTKGTGWSDPLSGYLSDLMLVPMDTWLNDPAGTQHGGIAYYVWGHYSLRWGGRMDKVYAKPRLMLAEGSNCLYWHPPMYWETSQHGGTLPAGVLPTDSKPKVNMNVVSSEGSVRTLMDWANTAKWKWTDTYYYPSNEKSGDCMVTQYDLGPGISDWCWNDSPFGFWTNFDRQVFNGGCFPWSLGWDWAPSWWNGGK